MMSTKRIGRVPADFLPTGPYASGLLRLADAIHYRTSQRRDKDDGRYSVAFGAKQWTQAVGKPYGNVKTAAIKQGLIEVVKTPRRGHHSQHVRLCEPYWDGRFRVVELTGFRRKHPRLIGLDEITEWLVGWFDSFALSYEPYTGCHWELRQFADLKERRYFASRDHFGRRFHTHYSNLPKSARRLLTLPVERRRGEQTKQVSPSLCGRSDRALLCGPLEANDLVELDVACCQPLLLSPEAPSEARWRSLCESGTLYEHFIKVLSDDRDWPGEPSRDKIKDLVMVVFNDRLRHTKTKFWRTFSREFPRVAEAIVGIKRSSNYKAVGQRLQRRESRLMIDGVCGQIRRYHPNEPILTIHDAIICRHAFASVASDLIVQSFRSEGLTPRIKSKPIREVGPGSSKT